jgi:phage FluMu gp28-like protein
MVEQGTKRQAQARIMVASMFDSVDAKLDWWQNQYLTHDPTFIIANKSRRIGWSFITAMKGLLDANLPTSKRYVKQFVSYSHDDAKEKILFAKEMYENLPRRYRKKIITNSKTQLEFLDSDGRSVSRLISHPCKPVRGKGGIVSLDEFAFHVKPDQIYTSALPAISRGGAIEIGSTPFGNSGRFYEILTHPEYSEYKRLTVPWWYSGALCTDFLSAMNDLDLSTEARVGKYGTEILQKIFSSLPIEDFQQEYECAFRDELSSYITMDMINSCVPVGKHEMLKYDSIDELLQGNSFRGIKPYDPDVHGTLYAGYDIGRTHDASELTIFGVRPDGVQKKCLASITYRGMPFDDQQAKLERLMNELPIHRMAIDSTGLGAHMAENLVKKKGIEWKRLPSPRRLKRILHRLYTLVFNGGSMYFRHIGILYNRFIQSKRLSLPGGTCDLTRKGTTVVMRISSGLSLLANMRLVVP